MTEKPAPPAPGETSLSAYEVRPVTAADMPQMQRLFKAVFNQEMSEALYNWKYRPGSSGAIGVYRDGELVAHYGGVGTDIVMRGKPARAIQIVDVMVSTAVRGGVRGQSPFFLAGSNFLQLYIGYQQPYLLGYGFPSDRHLKLAEHLGLYAPVGSMSELTIADATVKLADARWRWRQLTAESWPRYERRLDQIWQQMQQDLCDAIVVRKDTARIAYRYLNHPEQQYQLWMLQSLVLGDTKAMVVVKPEANRVLVMDVVAPLELLPDLLRLAAIEAKRKFALPLAAWFSTAHVQRIAPAEASVAALPITTPANIWTDGPEPSELQDRWWLTAGDTDFL